MSIRHLLAGAALALAAATAWASPPDHAPQRTYGYVFFDAGSRGAEMSGSIEDVRRAKALRTGDDGLLYVRQDGAAYVIRDAATLAKAKALFEPQEALGRQQAELGSRQAALGRDQAQLGAQQAALGRRQVSLSPDADAELSRQQAELGRQQAALGKRQGDLGRQQAELGRQQAEAGRIAEQQIRALLDEAVRSGLAKRID